MTKLFFVLTMLGLAPFAMTLLAPGENAKGCLDRRQAADYLSISTRLLDRIASDGLIPKIKIGTKTLFRIADLDAFIATKVHRLEAGE